MKTLQDCDVNMDSTAEADAEEFPDIKGDSEEILDRDPFEKSEDD